jgi:hypothetical protein
MRDQIEMFLDNVDYNVRNKFSESADIPDEESIRKAYELNYDALLLITITDATARASIDRDTVIDRLVKQYCTDLSVTKKVGFSFKDAKSIPWLKNAEEEIESRNGWFYWSRYKMFLLNEKKWAPNAVRAIERDTWTVLDLMANPRSKEHFERRGLVVASVQSGKTANYIGLICRAADAGYKIIIVMAGVYNVLRNQTQARLDEGFTGFKIVGTGSGSQITPVGVDKRKNAERRPIACTSRESDFNKVQATAWKGIQTANTNEAMLFVIKKNSRALKQVYEWLRDNAKADDPLLLIDDEADNASINGKYKKEKREDEPTRINGGRLSS